MVAYHEWDFQLRKAVFSFNTGGGRRIGGAMQISFGGVSYTLQMVLDGLVHPTKGPANGLTWPDKALIQIDGRLPYRVRLKTLWHEIGHAFKTELDIHDAPGMEEEAFCNLVALGMAQLSPETYLRLRVWAKTGHACKDVMYLPGMAEPMPVWRTPDEPPEIQRE